MKIEKHKRRYGVGLVKFNASIKPETRAWLLAQPEGGGATVDRLVEKEVAESVQKLAESA